MFHTIFIILTQNSSLFMHVHHIYDSEIALAVSHFTLITVTITTSSLSRARSHLHDRYGPAEDKPDERVLAVFPVKDKQWECDVYCFSTDCLCSCVS